MSKHSAKSGEQLWKKIKLKIVAPQTDRPLVRVLYAKPGQGFTKALIADVLAAASLEVQEAFPTHQFRMVQVGEAEFNFVPTGIRIANAS
jgi:hypothetical protein